MASLIELRILKNGASRYEMRPGVFDTIGYSEGETLYVSPALADALTSAGIAAVAPSRSVEVETATREPRGERAIAVKRRGRR